MVNSQKKILNKRLFREFKSNYKSFIAIILIALLCVTLFTGLFANYHYFKENLDDLYEKSNVADLFVTVDNCKDNDTEALLNDPIYEIKDMEKRVYSDAYIKERKIYLVVSDDENKISVPASIIEGEYKSDGVLISEAFAKKRKIKVGDTVTMNLKIALKNLFLNDEDLSIKLKESLREGKIDIYNDSEEMNIDFKITGIMTHAEAVGNLAASNGILYMNQSTLKKSVIALMKDTYDLGYKEEKLYSSMINHYDLCNQYVIKGGNLDKIREYFINKGENNNLQLVCDRSLMPGNQSVEIDVMQAKKLCYVFPIIFYIVGVLIIIASVDKQISKDKQYIGLMSALGINRKTIVFHYAKMSLAMVLIGGVLGLILGPILIPNIMNIKYGILYNLHSVRHHIIYFEYVICFIVIIFITLLVSFILSRKYVNINPAYVLRNNDKKTFKELLIEKISFVNKHMSAALKMTLRNIKRNFKVGLLVIIGVMGCTALLLCGFGIDDTLNYGLDLELEEKITYDLELSYVSDKIKQEDIINYDNSINYVEFFQYSVCLIENDGAVIDSTFTVLERTDKCYKIECKDEGVTLSKKVAETLNVKVGDEVIIHYANKLYPMKVTNIVSMFMSQGIYMKDTACPFNVKYNRAYLLVDDKTDIDLLGENISNDLDGINKYYTIESRRTSANEALSSIRIITITVKVFAILLAVAVIYNLAELNYKERIRDIATMKVLGYGYKDISKTLVYEILILTILGSLIGMTLGYPLLYSVLSINEPSAISYIYKINGISYLYAILITAGVSIILNLLISLKTRKIKMVEALKSVE